MSDLYTPKEIVSLMGLVDTYKRWVNHSQRGERNYNFYHPSEFGKCLRKQQYHHYASIGLIESKYEEFDSKILRLFDKGHNMHIRWANYFEGCGVLRGRWKCANPACQIFRSGGEVGKSLSKENILSSIGENKSRIYGREEVKGVFKPERCICGCTKFEYLEVPVFSEELNIKGHADLIIDCSNLSQDTFKKVRTSYNLELLPKDGKTVVADMKTIGSRAWTYQLQNKGPHKEYLIQLTCYAHILDCDYGILIYENKDNSEMKWYKVQRNEKWWETIKWQALTMKNMVEERKLPPPRPKKKECYECKGCPYKSICFKSKIWKDEKIEEKRLSFYRELL